MQSDSWAWTNQTFQSENWHTTGLHAVTIPVSIGH